MMKIDLERLYSKEEIAEVFRMSPKTIQREINLGRLRASRMANRQHMAS
jgi:DNA-directed RNA polymerase specialized sigma24 family protein